MKVIRTRFPEVLMIEPERFDDQRGIFLNTFHVDDYASHGIRGPFVQDSMSRSAYGVLRGLHLQNLTIQGKLVTVLRGRVLDVVVDVRVGSPNFGQHVATELSEDSRLQVWVPRTWGIDAPTVGTRCRRALADRDRSIAQVRERLDFRSLTKPAGTQNFMRCLPNCK